MHATTKPSRKHNQDIKLKNSFTLNNLVKSVNDEFDLDNNRNKKSVTETKKFRRNTKIKKSRKRNMSSRMTGIGTAKN